jgi:hypothetical protein
MPWCRIPFLFVRIFFLLELHAGSQKEAKVTLNKSCTKNLSSFCFLVVGENNKTCFWKESESWKYCPVVHEAHSISWTMRAPGSWSWKKVGTVKLAQYVGNEGGLAHYGVRHDGPNLLFQRLLHGLLLCYK